MSQNIKNVPNALWQLLHDSPGKRGPFIEGQVNIAQSAAFLHSTHQVTQKANGKTSEPVTDT